MIILLSRNRQDRGSIDYQGRKCGFHLMRDTMPAKVSHWFAHPFFRIQSTEQWKRWAFFFSLYRTMTEVPSPQSDKVPCNSSSNWHRGEVYLTFLRIVMCISEAPEAVENRDIASLKRLPFPQKDDVIRWPLGGSQLHSGNTTSFDLLTTFQWIGRSFRYRYPLSPVLSEEKGFTISVPKSPFEPVSTRTIRYFKLPETGPSSNSRYLIQAWSAWGLTYYDSPNQLFLLIRPIDIRLYAAYPVGGKEPLSTLSTVELSGEPTQWKKLVSFDVGGISLILLRSPPL